MSKKGHLPAFSMIEAVVGMAITAIIMGIIFVIFSLVTERMLDYKNQNQLVNDLNRLTFSLNKDIFESETMQSGDNNLEFQGYSGDKVDYHFQEEYILRATEIFTDTFRVPLRQLAIDSVKSKSEKLVFRRLKVEVEVSKQPMELKFYKQVYANELLEAQNTP